MFNRCNKIIFDVPCIWMGIFDHVSEWEAPIQVLLDRGKVNGMSASGQ